MPRNLWALPKDSLALELNRVTTGVPVFIYGVLASTITSLMATISQAFELLLALDQNSLELYLQQYRNKPGFLQLRRAFVQVNEQETDRPNDIFSAAGSLKDKPSVNDPSDGEPSNDELPDDEPSDDELPDDKPPDDEPLDDEPPDDEPPDDKPPDDKPPDDEPPDDEPPDDEPSNNKLSDILKAYFKTLRIALSIVKEKPSEAILSSQYRGLDYVISDLQECNTPTDFVRRAHSRLLLAWLYIQYDTCQRPKQSYMVQIWENLKPSAYIGKFLGVFGIRKDKRDGIRRAIRHGAIAFCILKHAPEMPGLAFLFVLLSRKEKATDPKNIEQVIQQIRQSPGTTAQQPAPQPEKKAKPTISDLISFARDEAVLPLLLEGLVTYYNRVFAETIHHSNDLFKARNLSQVSRFNPESLPIELQQSSRQTHYKPISAEDSVRSSLQSFLAQHCGFKFQAHLTSNFHDSQQPVSQQSEQIHYGRPEKRCATELESSQQSSANEAEEEPRRTDHSLGIAEDAQLALIQRPGKQLCRRPSRERFEAQKLPLQTALRQPNEVMGEEHQRNHSQSPTILSQGHERDIDQRTSISNETVHGNEEGLDESRCTAQGASMDETASTIGLDQYTARGSINQETAFLDPNCLAVGATASSPGPAPTSALDLGYFAAGALVYQDTSPAPVPAPDSALDLGYFAAGALVYQNTTPAPPLDLDCFAAGTLVYQDTTAGTLVYQDTNPAPPLDLGYFASNRSFGLAYSEAEPVFNSRM